LLALFPNYENWDALMASVDAPAALKQEAEYLAAAIVNFTNLVRVETVLLAGDLQAQSQRLIPFLEERIQGRSLALGETPLYIAPALMGPDTYIQAACNIVFGHFLEVC
jgi:predicted NBD/HSP70 family sugar kinase